MASEKEPAENSPLTIDEDHDIEQTPSRNFKKSWEEISKSPKDLWNLFTMRLIGLIGYWIMLICYSNYLTEILELTDLEYGYYSFIVGFIQIVTIFMFGDLPERFGIKNTMFVSFIIGTISYICMALIPNVWIQLILIFVVHILMNISMAVSKYAVKKYTTLKSRNFAFSIYALITYLAIGFTGIYIGISLGIGGENEDSYRVIWLVAAGLLLTSAIQSLYLRELDFAFRGEEEIPISHSGESVWNNIKGSFAHKSFWRYLVICFLFSGVRTVYAQVTLTLPLYMERDIGDESGYAYVIALLNLFLIFFSPFSAILGNYFDLFTCLIIGSVFFGLSPLIFLFGASYVTVIGFCFIAALGESITFPKLIEIASAVSPKGKEGGYFSISTLPYPLGFQIAGLCSGYFMDSWCPEDGEKECWKVWLCISIISLASLLFLIFGRVWLEQPRIETNPYVPWSKEAEEDKNN